MFSSCPTTRDISHARCFEEPLVPIGAEPTPGENAAVAGAITGYSQRSYPEDFSRLTEFLEAYPNSCWKPALLTNLGLEYYRTGRYSKTLEVWHEAWELSKSATDVKGKALADRAFGELVYMQARLGHMAELDATLGSVRERVFVGAATERVTGAREGLANMQVRPEISFRCGPHALYRVIASLQPKRGGHESVYELISTTEGCSLEQVAELSRELGLDFRMAYREKHAAIVCPSVVHFKVDHFAAIIQQRGDRYLLQDPTFGNDVWLSTDTLEAESSGYFLVPPAELIAGWRTVEAEEGRTVWGKGNTGNNDPGPHGPCDPASPGGGSSCPKDGGDCKGLAVSRVHLMLVSLNINDEPVGYSPPVGPAVRFTVRYNQRDADQPANFLYSNLGHKWTFDWLSYITDNPFNPFVDLGYYIMGGGTRTFTGFANSGNTSVPQQLDQTQLIRTAPSVYEMSSRDGSKKVFSQPDSSVKSSRKVFLTQIIDSNGNAVSIGYDVDLRVTAITDAIGQVTTISYDHPTDHFKITKVADPFGRFATFDYDAAGRLSKITDVIGLTSEFTYDAGDFITALTTPYGVTSFVKGEGENPPINTRSLETTYPDGDRDRVEYNQTIGIPSHESPRSVPADMATFNDFLQFRNTYYWSKIAYAAGYPDYTKAKIYHWLHGLAHLPNSNFTSGILESVKEPLEGRVWFDYAGQDGSPNGSISVGATNKPAHIGRVLDDGSTQLYSYEYNGFGRVTKEVDPVGRTFSYVYAENGIDLLEVQQTRAGQKQVLSKRTHDAQHLLLTFTDAAGQTTTYTYNARGQVLTKTDAKNETTTYAYDIDGRLSSKNGPLPGASTTFTYDPFSRVLTRTDESGYRLTFDYDDLDRLTQIAFPDGTFDQFTYTMLDQTLIRDRAGRQTTFDYDSIRQMTKRVNVLKRATMFQWCKCGELKGLTDPMGRTTSWRHDIQGRLKSKEYSDGSKVTYLYEETGGRLRQRIDEQFQVTQYNYNRDNTVSRMSYFNAVVATPSVAFTYDANYTRLRSTEDGAGRTSYSYIPIHGAPLLGAGQLASVNGPLPGDMTTYSYDELGRLISTAINGVPSSVTYDAAGRIVNSTNALGAFNSVYDGASFRKLSESYPNGQTAEFTYAGNLQDQHLQRITNKLGITPISEFIYGRDFSTGQITSWSQQAGTKTPSVFSLAYDQVDQLTAASVSTGGTPVKSFSYSYDSAGNRLTEQIDATVRQFSYNALNELTSVEGDTTPTTYQWDAEHRLISVTVGNQETRFTYDGFDRRVAIRRLVNGAEVSDRRFLWCGDDICEERTSGGLVVKRFLFQGMTVEAGVKVGKYFYTRDHLGSVRELIDDAGSTRARFGYEPYGVQVQMAGDLESDFGFTGHFYDTGTGLCLAKHRAYDPKLAHWLSRDTFPIVEAILAPSLYAYAGGNPINFVDLTGQLLAPPVPVVAVAASSSVLGPIGIGLALGIAALGLALAPPGPAPGPTSGTGPSGSGGGLDPAPAPGEGPAPGDSGGGYPYPRVPQPPPPLDPANCKGVEPFLAKLHCCIVELDLPTGDVCLTPEQQQQLNKCLSQ
jgi:RHS repeat-associated protein